MYDITQKVTNKIKLRLVITILVISLAIGATLAYLEKTNRINLLHEDVKTPTIGPETKGSNPNAQNNDFESSDEQGDQSTTGNTKRKDSNNSPKTLINPSGTFVSNHIPNLDGSPTPNLIQSVCVSTPGATCTITFTKGNLTKSLPEQNTDSEGAAYWNWKLQDIGLSEGEWIIQAISKLDGQTKTANDSLNLKVGP